MLRNTVSYASTFGIAAVICIWVYVYIEIRTLSLFTSRSRKITEQLFYLLFYMGMRLSLLH